MTIIQLTKKKGEKAIRTEYSNEDELKAWNEGSLLKHDDKTMLVAIFEKGSEVDKIISKSIERLEKKND